MDSTRSRWQITSVLLASILSVMALAIALVVFAPAKALATTYGSSDAKLLIDGSNPLEVIYGTGDNPNSYQLSVVLNDTTDAIEWPASGVTCTISYEGQGTFDEEDFVFTATNGTFTLPNTIPVGTYTVTAAFNLAPLQGAGVGDMITADLSAELIVKPATTVINTNQSSTGVLYIPIGNPQGTTLTVSATGYETNSAPVPGKLTVSGMNGIVNVSNPAGITTEGSQDISSYNITITPIKEGTTDLILTWTPDDIVDFTTANLTVPVEVGSGIFVDVPRTAWFYNDVYTALDHGIMKGYEQNNEMYFGPNNGLTRAQAAVVLWRFAEPEVANAYDVATAKNSTPWTDCANYQFYTGAMNWAYENRVLDGYNAVSAGPNDPLTREQMCAILYRFATVMYGSSTEGNNAQSYADAGDQSSVAPWAQEVVGWAYYRGIMTGYQPGNMLGAKNDVTRAQAAKMFVYTLGDVIGWGSQPVQNNNASEDEGNITTEPGADQD